MLSRVEITMIDTSVQLIYTTPDITTQYFLRVRAKRSVCEGLWCGWGGRAGVEVGREGWGGGREGGLGWRWRGRAVVEVGGGLGWRWVGRAGVGRSWN